MFRFIIFRVCLSIAPTKWVFPTLLSHSIVMGWHYLRQSNQFSAFFTRLSAQKRHFKEQWYFAKWEFNNEYETYLQRRKTTLQSIDSNLQEQQNEEEGRKKLTTKKRNRHSQIQFLLSDNWVIFAECQQCLALPDPFFSFWICKIYSHHFQVLKTGTFWGWREGMWKPLKIY